MSGHHQIPKSVFSSPQLEDKDDTSTLRKAAIMHEILTVCAFTNPQEIHQNRIKMLRKQTDYLKETEWKYEPIDKFIGQR